jgi:hypothetical protein
MQAARDYIRAHLARALSDPDARLAAAWTVAAGRAMATHSSIAAYDAATATVRILVADTVWLEPLTALRSTLTRDLARISGLPVTTLHFELEKPNQPRITRINTD